MKFEGGAEKFKKNYYVSKKKKNEEREKGSPEKQNKFERKGMTNFLPREAPE